MTNVTRPPEGVRLTVRFFAAARDAADADSAVLTLPAGATVADAIGELSGWSGVLASVLQKCSFLYDGVAVRDTGLALGSHPTLDVLPPFAGG